MNRRTHRQLTRKKKNDNSPRREHKLTPEQAPQSAEQYFRWPPEVQDQWNRVTHAVAKMRTQGISIQQAERDFGLAPGTVAHVASSALRKNKKSQFIARPSDNLLRVLVFPTPEGLSEIALRDSRQASVMGEYWAAVQNYLETGESSRLRRFTGMHVTGEDGKEISLLTDLDELDRLGSAGVLSFESLYARSA